MSSLSPPFVITIYLFKVSSSSFSSSKVLPRASGNYLIVKIGTPFLKAYLYFRWDSHVLCFRRDSTSLSRTWGSPQINPLIPLAGYSTILNPSYFRSKLKWGLKLFVLPVKANVNCFLWALLAVAAFLSSLLPRFEVGGLPTAMTSSWTFLRWRLYHLFENSFFEQYGQDFTFFNWALSYLLFVAPCFLTLCLVKVHDSGYDLRQLSHWNYSKYIINC